MMRVKNRFVADTRSGSRELQLAGQRYEEYKPLLKEIEKIQAEAGLDAEDMRNAAKGGGASAGGTGVDSRNRR